MVRLSENEQVTRLYDLWYQQKEDAMKVYTDELPLRIPLMDNKEFKSLKNAIIQEALKISEQAYSESEQEHDEESDNELVSISGNETQTAEKEPDENTDSEEIPDNLEIPPETVQCQYRTGNQHGYYAAMGSLRLLRYLARTLQNRIDNQKIKADRRIDRKLYQKIQDKKHAQGLK